MLLWEVNRSMVARAIDLDLQDGQIWKQVAGRVHQVAQATSERQMQTTARTKRYDRDPGRALRCLARAAQSAHLSQRACRPCDRVLLVLRHRQDPWILRRHRCQSYLLVCRLVVRATLVVVVVVVVLLRLDREHHPPDPQQQQGDPLLLLLAILTGLVGLSRPSRVREYSSLAREVECLVHLSRRGVTASLVHLSSRGTSATVPLAQLAPLRTATDLHRLLTHSNRDQTVRLRHLQQLWMPSLSSVAKSEAKRRAGERP